MKLGLYFSLQPTRNPSQTRIPCPSSTTCEFDRFFHPPVIRIPIPTLLHLHTSIGCCHRLSTPLHRLHSKSSGSRFIIRSACRVRILRLLRGPALELQGNVLYCFIRFIRVASLVKRMSCLLRILSPSFLSSITSTPQFVSMVPSLYHDLTSTATIFLSCIIRLRPHRHPPASSSSVILQRKDRRRRSVRP